MTAYKCTDCGHVFREPALGRTGVEHLGVWEMRGVCPSCGGDEYDEGRECVICGEFGDEEICEECLRGLCTLDNAIRYGKAIKGTEEANPALLYIIEGMQPFMADTLMSAWLKKQVGIYGEDEIRQHFLEFVKDDVDHFAEWYLKNREGRKHGRANLTTENGRNAAGIA